MSSSGVVDYVPVMMMIFFFKFGLIAILGMMSHNMIGRL